MRIVLQARDSSVKINHKVLDTDKKLMIGENFITQLEMEVRHNPKLAKKLLRTLTSTTAVFASTLLKMTPTKAAYSLAPTAMIVDPDLLQIFIMLIGAVALFAVLIAFITLMLAGTWKMLFGGRQADEWQQNIIKGLGQVLGAPIIIFLIVGTFMLIFKHIPTFNLILEPIATVFKFKM